MFHSELTEAEELGPPGEPTTCSVLYCSENVFGVHH